MAIERRDIEFKTLDGLTLRGWFYPASDKQEKSPGIVISNGWSCLKEMYLDTVAEKFQAIGVSSLVYDQRNFGSSGGTPRFEVNPHQQAEDVHEAVSFLLSQPEIDTSKIALWGYSLSATHAIKVAAIDRRVKAIITIAPMLSCVRLLQRLIRRDTRAAVDKALLEDRQARVRGEEPTYSPITSLDPSVQSFMPMADAAEFFFRMQRTIAPNWENRHTVQSMYHLQGYEPSGYVEAVSPTPWLMIQGDDDNMCAPDLGLKLFEKAPQPKELLLYEGGHFSFYDKGIFEEVMSVQIEFLKRRLKF